MNKSAKVHNVQNGEFCWADRKEGIVRPSLAGAKAGGGPKFITKVNAFVTNAN